MRKFERIALIIGNDNYIMPTANLSCCVNDAIAMRETLICHDNGAPNFDCTRTFTSEDYKIDIKFLRYQIESFFELESSVALFYFSGHGFCNNVGGFLVTHDAENYKEGLRMDELLIAAKNAIEAGKMKDVIFILDCCHSGSFGQRPGLSDSVLGEGISILAASRNYENAVEVNGSGRFTRLVLNALKGGAADLCGEVKIPSIFAYVDDALGADEQRPVFKANVSKLVSLRDCNIDLQTSVLRLLIEIFESPFSQLQLNPAYLPDGDSSDAYCQKIFSYLVYFEDRQLLKSLRYKDLMITAKKSGKCMLNERGKYYWQLVNDYNINKY